MRRLYDELGDEGVKASWQLGPYNGGLQEKARILEAIELARLAKASRLDHYTVIENGVDVSSWFDEDVAPLEYGQFFPDVGITKITQDFDFWLTPEYRANFHTSVGNKEGMGLGGSNIKLSRIISPELQAAAEFGFASGLGNSLSLGLTRQPSDRELMFTRATLHKGIAPLLQVGYSRMVKGVAANMEVRLGFQKTIRFSASWTSKSLPEASVVEVVLASTSPEQSSIKYTSTIALKDNLNVSARLKLGPSARTKVSVGLERIWNPIYTTQIYLETDMAYGVSLRLALHRESKYQFDLPIRLSSECNLVSVCVGSAISAITGFLLDQCILGPWQRYVWAKEKEENEAEYEKQLQEQIIETALVQDILQAAYDKRLAAENGINGLIITKAIYKSKSGPEIFDVTIPLQSLIVDSQLLVQGGTSKSKLLGFYNIAPHATKQLVIEYTFHGEAHSTVIEDTQDIILPQRIHRR